MPSGRYLTAQVVCYGECIMNIVVHALIGDRDVSGGLCGNYDGLGPNDLTQGGLSRPPFPQQPIEFAKSFM